jgi:YggT family protein
VFVYTNFVVTLLGIVSQLLGLYLWVVIISAVMTWIEPNPYNPIVRFIYGITEPLFDFVRRHLPVTVGGFDFSPIVVLIAIEFIQGYFIPTFARLATTGFN